MSADFRGSSHLLDGVSVVLVDGETATLAAGWWLAELGAGVAMVTAEPDQPDGQGAGLFRRFLTRRVERVAQGAPATFSIESQGASSPSSSARLVAPGGTRVIITGPGLPGEAGPLPWGDVVAWARSAMADLTRPGHPAGVPDVPRLSADPQPSFLAGTLAAIIVCAIEQGARRNGRRPSAVEIDRQEVLAALPQQPIAAAQLAAEPERPAGRRFPGGVHRADGGLVFVQPFEPVQWERLLARVPGREQLPLSSPPSFDELTTWRAEIDQALARYLANRPARDVVAELQDDHIPAATVAETDAVLGDEHLRARRFSGEDGPSVPWIRVEGRADPDPRSAASAHVPAPRLRVAGNLPLRGYRVLDLTWAWAGPFATTLLADLGAEVINVEWWPRPSNLRSQPPFAVRGSSDAGGWWSANQRGKLSIGVNLKHPEGVAVVLDLAAVSDVALENFSPGVATRLGVGFGDLLTRNPDLVYVSMSAFGATGPAAHWVGYGTQILAASGMTRATLPDDGVVALMGIPYPDPVSGLAGALAAVAATGRGPAHLDVSELEATCPPIFGTLLGDRPPQGSAAPALLTTADGRHVFVQLPGDTLARVRADAPALSSAELVDVVEGSGGRAVVVARPADLLHDERLRARGFWRADQAPLLEARGVEVAGPPFLIDGRRPAWWRGAPDLFQDTSDVLQDILGYGRERIEHLVAEGAIGVRQAASADAT